MRGWVLIYELAIWDSAGLAGVRSDLVGCMFIVLMTMLVLGLVVKRENITYDETCLLHIPSCPLLRSGVIVGYYEKWGRLCYASLLADVIGREDSFRPRKVS